MYEKFFENPRRVVAGIPEHLLKRAQAARDALAGKAPSAETGESASNLPAKTSETKPASGSGCKRSTTTPARSKLCNRRKDSKENSILGDGNFKFVAIMGFSLRALNQTTRKTVEGPMAVGAGVYGSCAGCHGANGAGGAGRVLHQGEVLKTFPRIEDMLNFVYTGSQAYVAAEIKIYGNPDREGGAHEPLSYNGNPMPQQGAKYGGGLTDAEILGVVCHERYAIGGADKDSEEWKAEYEMWCSPESEIFLGLEAGSVNYDNLAESFAALPMPPARVGTDPRPTGK